MQCQICKSPAGMRKCNKCGHVYCGYCAPKGLGNYPKTNAFNRCPNCGEYKTESFR